MFFQVGSTEIKEEVAKNKFWKCLHLAERRGKTGIWKDNQNFENVSRKFYVEEAHFKERDGQLCLVGKSKADDMMMNTVEKNESSLW